MLALLLVVFSGISPKGARKELAGLSSSLQSEIPQLYFDVDRDKKPISVSIHGRHDPIIVPRAVVVVESMAALVLADALLLNMSARMDYLETIYKK